MEIANNSDKPDNIVPMFLSQITEQPMAHDAKTHYKSPMSQDTKQNNKAPQEAELSVFDVKELYDLAYAEKNKGNDTGFKSVLAEAVKLDMAYRRQLAKMSSYKSPSKLETFDDVMKASHVA